MGRLVTWEAYMLVFVDESGAHERTGDRKYGWSLRGLASIEYSSIKCSERWSILPALTLDGWIDCLIFQGGITAQIFVDWLEQKVLPQCNPYPGPRSVLIMDNASIHKTARVQELCDAAGVQREDLPLYCPEFNPIEATFGDLKAWIKKNHRLAELFHDFGAFLIYATEQVGGINAIEHFKKATYIVNSKVI
jgi:transposase